MRDTSYSRTVPLSLGTPARQRTGQSGAALLPPLAPCPKPEPESKRVLRTHTRSYVELREDYDVEDRLMVQGACLDAPDYLPAGSARSSESSYYFFDHGALARPGLHA